MEFITTKEAADKWELSEQAVRRFCRNGKVPGAIHDGSTWLIPEKARRPCKSESVSVETTHMHPLAKSLVRQKTKKIYHGLYDYVQINLTYSSSRMASNRLTRNQVETIFKKGKVAVGFEPMKVADVIEVLNHIHCVNYIMDRVMEPLTQKFIRKLHEILMAGTVDAYRKQVRPGEYRTATTRPRDWEMMPASQINTSLTSLIEDYEHQTEIERNQILDFHVRFEEIFPFEDGNGRVGRLIMLKECLRHGVTPFIIDDKRRSRYLRGVKEWHIDRYELVDVAMEAQSRFEAQIELQRLHAAGQFFLPATYQEGLRDEDE